MADAFRNHDRKAMAAGGPSINQEWLDFAADGHRALHLTTKTPLYDPAGQVLGVLGIARDITALDLAARPWSAAATTWRDRSLPAPPTSRRARRACA